MNERAILKKFLLNSIVRFALTIAILVVVWRHAHWSVALTLTNLCVNVEISAAVFKVKGIFQ